MVRAQTTITSNTRSSSDAMLSKPNDVSLGMDPGVYATPMEHGLG